MNYAARAKIHEDYVKEHFAREISDSIHNTTMYFSKTRKPPNVPHGKKIALMRASSSDALFSLMKSEEERDKKIAVLNFASYK